MIRKGIATFGLDYGQCPRWLFERMVKLGREMTRLIVAEFGPEEFIKRIADPVWFQSLGTVLAFDWNASGLTTLLTAALKEAIKGEEKELGVFICGGKGKTSLKTPDEISNWGEKLNLPGERTRALAYNSRMAAKVDSALVQDGFQIYHHSFFFVSEGAWTVVQQGMNKENQTARRYHWSSDSAKDLVSEPHSGIISDLRTAVLNLVSKNSAAVRDLSTEMVDAGYYSLMRDIQILRRHSSAIHKTLALRHTGSGEQLTLLHLENEEFRRHSVLYEDFSKSRYLEKILWIAAERKPETYEKLLAIQGVGPKTMRALALVGEILYGARASYEDPARYSFAHGGKDATPYPVDRETYDATIGTMKMLVQKMKIASAEKQKIIDRIEDRKC